MAELEQRIPKTIHYCWLSGDQMPSHILQCMNTWKEKMPDYELVLWDMDRIRDIQVAFVREAIKARKWAFAADYIRFLVLHNEGGIYLDTDVFVLKTFDDLLVHSFFSSVEINHEAYNMIHYKKSLQFNQTKNELDIMRRGIQIQAAVVGAVKGHPFLRDVMRYYEKEHFIKPDGSYNQKYLAPAVLATIAESYGFLRMDIKQELTDGLVIFPSEIFASHGQLATDRAYCVHICAGGWLERTRPTFFERMLIFAKNYNLFRRLAGKMPILINQISYRLRKDGVVTCRVLSLYRKHFLDYHIGFQLPGKHSFHITALSIPDEKYICQIIQNDRLIKEVIIVKNILGG